MNTNEQIALVALNNMFKGNHFSICTIDSVCKVLSVVPNGAIYNQLRALHCVDWKDMPRSLYQQIPDMIKQCISEGATHRFYLADDEPTGVTGSVAKQTREGTLVLEGPRESRKIPLLSRWLHD